MNKARVAEAARELFQGSHPFVSPPVRRLTGRLLSLVTSETNRRYATPKWRRTVGKDRHIERNKIENGIRSRERDKQKSPELVG